MSSIQCQQKWHCVNFVHFKCVSSWQINIFTLFIHTRRLKNTFEVTKFSFFCIFSFVLSLQARHDVRNVIQSPGEGFLWNDIQFGNLLGQADQWTEGTEQGIEKNRQRAGNCNLTWKQKNNSFAWQQLYINWDKTLCF